MKDRCNSTINLFHLVREDVGLFRRVVIASRLDMEEAVELAGRIAEFIRAKGLTLILESALASKLGEKGVSLNHAEADLAVIVGGDGTVLQIAQQLGGRMPLFPVKMGRVGFFASATAEDVFQVLDGILQQKFVYDECSMLTTNLNVPEALNEVHVGTVIPRQMMDVTVLVDGVKVAKDRVDAVVIATQIGSSAYALSAGANIIDPKVEAIAIVPVCPLSANFKPYIISSNSVVSVIPESSMEYIILIDGQFQKSLDRPMEIKIWKSKRKVSFLRTTQNFYERLRRRLQVSSIA